MKFVVGDLPEIVEDEIDGEPIPVAGEAAAHGQRPHLPARGRRHLGRSTPRRGRRHRRGHAARLGSPLDARLEVLDANGPTTRRERRRPRRRSARALHRRRPTAATGPHPRHQRHAAARRYVYRLTLTADAFVDRVYPAGRPARQHGSSCDCSARACPTSPSTSRFPPTPVPTPPASRRRQVDQCHSARPRRPARSTSSNDAETVKPLTCRSMLNGRIDKPGEVDAGPSRRRRATSARSSCGPAGSVRRSTASLTVLDAAGKELARAEAGGRPATRTLRFTAPADGDYHGARRRISFRSRGGPEFAYRLRIAPPAAARLPPDAGGRRR